MLTGAAALRRLAGAARLAGLVLLVPGTAAAEGGVVTARGGNLMLVSALMPITGPEFQTLWNTPRDQTPDLPSMSMAAEGQVVTYVAFVAGMTLDAAQTPDLTCRVAFAAREGAGQMAFDGPCLNAPLPGAPSDQYAAVIFDFRVPQGFAGEIIMLRAQVTDRLSGAEVEAQLAMPVVAGGTP
ncbi:MAG: hypothetical protein KDK12_00705 [Rhodobacteraceae bacterium]|nr:hypothetical protein [Paracoccaceae bacterium]